MRNYKSNSEKNEIILVSLLFCNECPWFQKNLSVLFLSAAEELKETPILSTERSVSFQQKI